MPLPLIAAGGSLLTTILSYTFIASLIARVLAALGLGVFAFVGLDQGLDALHGQINAHLGGAPADIKAILDMAGITTILFWIIQAHALRAVLRVGSIALFRTSKVT